MKDQFIKKKITDKEIRQLIIERLKSLPSDKRISLGLEGDFNKEELIAHVKKQDKIGKKIIKVQLEFLRSLKKGVLFNE